MLPDFYLLFWLYKVVPTAILTNFTPFANACLLSSRSSRSHQGENIDI